MKSYKIYLVWNRNQKRIVVGYCTLKIFKATIVKVKKRLVVHLIENDANFYLIKI